MSNKNIIIKAEDLPSKNQILQSIFRLNKFAEILSKLKGKNDTDDPIAHKAVASFLDLLIKRDGKLLNKDDVNVAHALSMQEYAIRYLANLSDEEIIQKIKKMREDLK